MDYLNKILRGDCRGTMLGLPSELVQTCITSPPYWGLRDYGLEPTVWSGESDCCHEWGFATIVKGDLHYRNVKWQTGGQPKEKESTGVQSISQGQFCQKCNAWLGVLGLEPTPEMYIDHLVQIFGEVWRVLRKDGTCWINIGDSYNGSGGAGGDYNKGGLKDGQPRYPGRNISTLKPKDMVLIPQRLMIALQEWGWWVRSVIIWEKPSCMPSSVKDRPTTSHEYVLLLAKDKKYYYDQDAIRESHKRDFSNEGGGWKNGEYKPGKNAAWKHDLLSKRGANQTFVYNPAGRNKRTVWTINPKPYKEAHFATFPPKLVEPMILAGTSPQACPHCLAPWTRLVKTPTIPNNVYTGSVKPESINPIGNHTVGMGQKLQDWREQNPPQTVGWQPTCDCADNDGSGRCIVLDPFAGSGTTCAVAVEHGRDYVGIEANPEYCKLAEKRIAETQPRLS